MIKRQPNKGRWVNVIELLCRCSLCQWSGSIYFTDKKLHCTTGIETLLDFLRRCSERSRYIVASTYICLHLDFVQYLLILSFYLLIFLAYPLELLSSSVNPLKIVKYPIRVPRGLIWPEERYNIFNLFSFNSLRTERISLFVVQCWVSGFKFRNYFFFARVDVSSH